MKKFQSEADLELASVPTLAAVEKAIGLKAVKWKARCHEIACKMLTTKVAVGVERYGHYYGPVSRDYKRYGLPFQPHGWIETPRGLVIDPTRWVFRMVDPYIFYGPTRDYDVGGQRLSVGHLGSYPLGPQDESKYSQHLTEDMRALRREVIQLVMPRAARQQLVAQTVGQYKDFSFDQVFWIAHAPVSWWGEHARAIYAAIEAAGHRAMIPFDCWRMVMDHPLASNLP